MAVTVDFERLRLRALLASLHDEVLDYSLDRRFSRTLERAARRAYGNEPRPSALLTELMENDVERERFFPWAIWDVRHDRGGSIGARFLAEHGGDLSEAERGLAALFLASHVAFYEVVASDVPGVRVRDVASGREIVVSDSGAASGPLVTGSVVFARLLEGATFTRFERVLVVLSPARFAQVQQRLPKLPRTPVAWRRAYPDLIQLLDEVREAGVEITTAEGETIVPCVAVFRHRARGAVAAALREARVVCGAGEGWLAVGDAAEAQPLGVATVHGRRLHVTCATVERSGRVRDLLEARLGAHEVSWVTTIFSNLDFVAIEMLETLRLPEPQVHDPALATALCQVVPEFLAEWWDVPNARLNGATPREVLGKGGRGRETVLAFLRELDLRLGADVVPLAAG